MDTYKVKVDNNRRQEIFQVEKRYVELRPVSEGSYGFVAAAKDNVNQQPVAIKKIANFLRDLDDAKRIAREIKLLTHLGGQAGVIQILDVMTSPPNTTDFTDVYIVCPLMESDLERIITSDQPLTDAHAQYFMYQLLKSLKYIHSAGIIHRDLKPGNLLVNANCDLSVCDFGLARSSEGQQLTEYVVTRWYRAPELLLSCSNYTEAIDMWSAGCILAELLGRKPLFPGRNHVHQLELIVSVLGSPTESEIDLISGLGGKDALRSLGRRNAADLKALLGNPNPLAVDLVAKMLAFDPSKRCNVHQALDHPWLMGYRDVATEQVANSAFRCDLDSRDASELGRAGLQRVIFNDMIDLKASARMPIDIQQRVDEPTTERQGNRAPSDLDSGAAASCLSDEWSKQLQQPSTEVLSPMLADVSAAGLEEEHMPHGPQSVMLAALRGVSTQIENLATRTNRHLTELDMKVSEIQRALQQGT
jgi:serine/threonine protein kinase